MQAPYSTDALQNPVCCVLGFEFWNDDGCIETHQTDR